MGYSKNDSMVRVDFFKQTGKWYTTEELLWDRFHSTINGEFEDIRETFKRLLDEQFPFNYTEMFAVCLHPCHEHEHPIFVNRLEKK